MGFIKRVIQTLKAAGNEAKYGEEEKNGGSEGLGSANPVGAEKIGTRFKANIFLEMLPPREFPKK